MSFEENEISKNANGGLDSTIFQSSEKYIPFSFISFKFVD